MFLVNGGISDHVIENHQQKEQDELTTVSLVTNLRGKTEAENTVINDITGLSVK